MNLDGNLTPLKLNGDTDNMINLLTINIESFTDLHTGLIKAIDIKRSP